MKKTTLRGAWAQAKRRQRAHKSKLKQKKKARMTEPYKHTHDPSCPSCENKLLQAHMYMRTWFRALKSKYPSVHISWSWRGKIDQNALVDQGKSKLYFPNSSHNKSDEGGNPCSLALDLFQIDDDGVARWSKDWFALVDQQNKSNREPIFWGGNWPHLGDGDHFEYEPMAPFGNGQ